MKDHFMRPVSARQKDRSAYPTLHVCTEMSAATLQVTRIFPDGDARWSGGPVAGPTGLPLRRRHLWIAEADCARLSASIPRVAKSCELRTTASGLPLTERSLLRKDGHLYLTDSGMAAQDFLDGQNFAQDYRKLPWDGAFTRSIHRGKVLRILDRGIHSPTGSLRSG